MSTSTDTTKPAAPTTPSVAPAATPAATPRARRPRPQLMAVTPAAAERVKALIDGRGKPTAGIRIGVRTKGCSGMSYTLEFADKQEPMDEVVETNGIKLLIDPKASLFLIGTEMDFEEEKLKSGFVFRNPNEKGRCGCGESFHV
jgi:iron-sulfur cluster assembly protein